MNRFYLLLLFFCSAHLYADQYLCVADKATGFEYDENLKRWNSVNFNVDNLKWVVSPGGSVISTYTDESGTTHTQTIGEYTVTMVGESEPAVLCEKGFGDSDLLVCRGAFQMNKRSGNYIKVNTGIFILQGVLGASNAALNTVHMEIGKCSEF